MKHLTLYSLIWLLAVFTVGSAQYISRYERPISTPVFFIPSTDSLIHLNEDSLIAAQIGVVDTTILPPKSTTVATLGSMILPGAGQIYNGSYWKAPVVWGFTYYFLSIYRNQDKLYTQSRNDYERSLLQIDTATVKAQIEKLQTEAKQQKSDRDFYKNQRNEFGWYFAITYILNVLDAYVDAALFNFEVSPNLQGTNQWRVSARIPIRQ